MTVDLEHVKAKKNQEPARVPGDGGQPQLPGKFRQLKTDHSRTWFCSRMVIICSDCRFPSTAVHSAASLDSRLCTGRIQRPSCKEGDSEEARRCAARQSPLKGTRILAAAGVTQELILSQPVSWSLKLPGCLPAIILEYLPGMHSRL